MILAPQMVMAGGGIYVDDFTVKNDGKVLFTDNFDDGSVSDWTFVRDATVVCDDATPRNCCLHVDRQRYANCCAYHAVSIPSPGVVELSAWIFLPPVEEQSCYTVSGGSFTGISVYSGSTKDDVAAAVELQHLEKGYRIRVYSNSYNTGKPMEHAQAVTPNPVLVPGKWARLTLKLAFADGKASAYLDDKMLDSVSFRPENYAFVKKVAAWGGLGGKPPSSASK